VNAAPVIAIDGPSASGKGTVAQAVARALGFHYLDSGALYRLVALAAMNRGTDLADEAALTALAGGLDARFEEGAILLEGKPATEAIRSEACSVASSRVAAVPGVRTALLDRQRAFRDGIADCPGDPHVARRLRRRQPAHRKLLTRHGKQPSGPARDQSMDHQ